MNSDNSLWAQLNAKINAFIENKSRGDFDKLASEVIQYQLSHNKPLRAFYTQKNFVFDESFSWGKAPFLTTDAFKEKPPLISFPSDEITGSFLTSGTTQGKRGQHFHRSLKQYQSSILKGWEHENLPTQNLYFLTQSATNHSESSLIRMFDFLGKKEGLTGQALENRFAFDSSGTLKPQWIIEVSNHAKPTFIAGPALAHMHLMKERHTLPLISGSMILETGGYKGLSITLNKSAFYQNLTTFYHLPENNIINEYGMTELSTPAYTRGLHQAHQLPHWAKALTVNPITNQPTENGEAGYLCLFDLANLDSVSAIRTQDFAICQNSQTFELLGRDPNAIKRGCSLSTEEMIVSQNQSLPTL